MHCSLEPRAFGPPVEEAHRKGRKPQSIVLREGREVREGRGLEVSSGREGQGVRDGEGWADGEEAGVG